MIRGTFLQTIPIKALISQYIVHIHGIWNFIHIISWLTVNMRLGLLHGFLMNKSVEKSQAWRATDLSVANFQWLRTRVVYIASYVVATVHMIPYTLYIWRTLSLANWNCKCKLVDCLTNTHIIISVGVH